MMAGLGAVALFAESGATGDGAAGAVGTASTECAAGVAGAGPAAGVVAPPKGGVGAGNGAFVGRTDLILRHLVLG